MELDSVKVSPLGISTRVMKVTETGGPRHKNDKMNVSKLWNIVLKKVQSLFKITQELYT